MSSVSLAEDIIMEILSRLPVKSLLRFKCVCKEWYQLIESPFFISKHFNRETNHSRLLIQYFPSGCRGSHFALFPDKDLNGAPPVHEDFHLQLDTGQIYGPVNGIFLLHFELFNPDQDDHLALLNPATRQFRRILNPKITAPNHFHVSNQVFGFGFDCLSNDYKVICFRAYWVDDQVHSDDEEDLFDDINALYDVEVIIYSLSKDSWTSPVIWAYDYPQETSSSTYVNGAYYWLCWHEYDECFLILSFDMATDVFRHINVPDEATDVFRHIKGPDDLNGDVQLLFYNDFLAILISDYISSSGSDYRQPLQIFHYVWIMKEEGCWTKLLTIGPCCQDHGPAHGIWNNEILVDNNEFGRILLYNIDSCEEKDLGLQNNSPFYAYAYKESLVSIKGTAEDWGSICCL